MANGNMPIKSFKAGAVKASVFENTNMYNGKQSTTYKVVIDKRYKDSNGGWQSTNSFSASNELPKAILVLQKAFEFCATLRENSDDKTRSVNEEFLEG